MTTKVLKDFYTIEQQTAHDENKYQVTVLLNPEAEVYKGHFPGQPVAPGACLTQMVKEVANDILGKDLVLREAQQIKFLATVNPVERRHLVLDLELSEVEGGFRLKCVASADNTSYFKISGLLA